MWQVVAKWRNLLKHRLGVLLLVMFPQRLPIRPDGSIVTQSTSQAFIHMRQQMKVTNVPLVKDECTKWTAEVDAS